MPAQTLTRLAELGRPFRAVRKSSCALTGSRLHPGERIRKITIVDGPRGYVSAAASGGGFGQPLERMNFRGGHELEGEIGRSDFELGPCDPAKVPEGAEALVLLAQGCRRYTKIDGKLREARSGRSISDKQFTSRTSRAWAHRIGDATR